MSDNAIDRLREAIRRTRDLTHDRTASGRTHDDADDVTGTIDTDDARGFDPLPLLECLHRAGAPVVVIGQVAGILHGSNELTGDLDLLWNGDPAHVPGLLAGFEAAGATLRDDDGKPVVLDAAAFARPKVQFAAPAASGDCCTPALPWGALAVADFIERADSVSQAGLTIRYLRLADLIQMRRAVGRPKDLRRIAELEVIAANSR
jgi:hypothetical protein